MSASEGEVREDTLHSDGEDVIQPTSAKTTMEVQAVERPRDSSRGKNAMANKKNRHKSQPSLDNRKRPTKSTAKSQVPSSDEGESSEEEKPSQLSFMKTLDFNVLNSNAESAVLQSTLLSINRIKEEKEFTVEEAFIKGGTLTAIVMWLIEYGERIPILCFLVCLPRYGLPEQLLALIHDKFKEQSIFYQDTQDPINFKTLSSLSNFLMTWLDCFYKRDFLSETCLSLLTPMLKDLLSTGLVDWHRKCMLVILRKSGHEIKSPLFTSMIKDTSEDAKATKKNKRSSSKKRSHSIAEGPVNLDSLTAVTIAEQLTLKEWELFRCIPDSDFLGKSWLVKPTPANSPLVQMVDNFNVISLWVTSEIVKTEDLKERAQVLKKFVGACDVLFELGNFNGLMEVVAGLSMGAVQRLTKTWSLAGSGTKSTFEKFSNIMMTKANFQTYRHALSNTKPPALPYVGVLLRDLIFIEEGNPQKLSSGFYNFDRIHLLGKLILDIQRYKSVSYDIVVSPPVQSYLAGLKPLETDDAIYAASMAAENDHDSLT